MHLTVRMLLLAGTALAPLGAAANPLDGKVTAGSAAIAGQGTANVQIQQSTEKAIINWRSFDIGVDETTRFVQPGKDSVTLNRVTGGLGASTIDGTLKANGNIFLVNPDGILFGPTSIVDTGGLVATTSDIADDDFMAGHYVFTRPGRPDASVINQGRITISETGIGAFVAPGVRNAGIITAKLGDIGLASANSFTLDFYGDELIKLTVGDEVASEVRDLATGQSLDALVKNEGMIKADGGRIALTATAARAVVDSVINNTGVIEANSVGVRNGRIVLGAATAATKPTDAPVQRVKVSGRLSAAGDDAGETGGRVEITGEAIELAGAAIDASGYTGGGTVLIGGDVGGGSPSSAVAPIPRARPEPEPIATATATSVDADSTIYASAIDSGDGGKAVVWADGATDFQGSVAAKGGAESGDGGFAEVSGKEHLAYSGIVDLSAAYGENGTLLLDPLNVLIGAGGLAASAIEAALSTGDVIVTTGTTGTEAGDITVAAPIVWSTQNTFSLEAVGNLGINASITGVNGGLVVDAGGAITANANVIADRFTLEQGDWSQVGATLPVFFANDFRVNGGSFLRALGGNGSTLAPYQITDVFGLQGIGTANLLDMDFILASDIDASSTAGWNGGAGFGSIGTPTSEFTGVLDGNGHIVDGLTIVSSESYAGLFGSVGSSGTIRNLTLTDAWIIGRLSESVGAVAAYNNGDISGVHVTGTVVGGDEAAVGAAIGTNSGSVSDAEAAASVSGGRGSMVGGLVGSNAGLIYQSAASSHSLPLVGSTENSGLTSASGLKIVGQYAYLTDSSGGLLIFDVSDPSGPSLVGSLGNIRAQDVIVSGQYAYVADANAGLKIVDVSDPSNPSLIGEQLFTGAYSVAVDGSLAYVADLNGGAVHVVDVSVAEAPAVVSSFASVNPYALEISDNLLYVADWAAAIHVLDISDPSNLVHVGSYTTPELDASEAGVVDTPVDLLVLEDRLYVADAASGFYILDITDPGLPSLIGGYNRYEDYTNVQVKDGYAYLSRAYESRIDRIDISSPISPFLAGTYISSQDSPFLGNDVDGGLVIDQTLAYVSRGSSLKIFDLSSPGSVLSADFYSSLGGLVGTNSGTIESSFADSIVYGQGPTLSGGRHICLGCSFDPSDIFDPVSPTGGLVGTNSGWVDDSFAIGLVRGVDETGGLVGLNQLDGTITTSYADASTNVKSTARREYCGRGGCIDVWYGRSGGLVGTNEGFITHSFAEESGTFGGLSGVNSGTIDSSFASGDALVGALAGFNHGAIALSYAGGDVTGYGCQTWGCGGLVGFNDGTIASSFAMGDVAVSGGFAGGLVGVNDGSIVASYASGDVSGGSVIGGFVGINRTDFNLVTGTISQSFALGSVTVSDSSSVAGGLVGTNQGSIIDAYAQGSVVGNHQLGRQYIGGLVGSFAHCDCPLEDDFPAGPYGQIESSYATGAVARTVSAGPPWAEGGLVATSSPDGTAVVSAYWDVSSTGQVLSEGGVGLTTAQLQTGLPAGFDSDVWATNPGEYPHLKWETAGLIPTIEPDDALPSFFDPTVWVYDPSSGRPELIWESTTAALTPALPGVRPAPPAAPPPAPTTTIFEPPFEPTPEPDPEPEPDPPPETVPPGTVLFPTKQVSELVAPPTFINLAGSTPMVRNEELAVRSAKAWEAVWADPTVESLIAGITLKIEAFSVGGNAGAAVAGVITKLTAIPEINAALADGDNFTAGSKLFVLMVDLFVERIGVGVLGLYYDIWKLAGAIGYIYTTNF